MADFICINVKSSLTWSFLIKSTLDHNIINFPFILCLILNHNILLILITVDPINAK